MARRVNPIMLLGLIIALVLSVGILASANLSGGSASDAIGVGEAQMGKPFVMSTDGPNTFSCVGLMRYILRTIGVDSDAPWVPEAYLSKYAPVNLGNLQPGDIVIYPGWATMYVGGGQLLNSNEKLGYVTHTSMSDAGTPLGAVRPPYGGGSPLPTDPATNGMGAPATNGIGAPVTNGMGDPAVNGMGAPATNGMGDPAAQQQATGMAPDPLLNGGTAPIDGTALNNGGAAPIDTSGGTVPIDTSGGTVPIDTPPMQP